MKTKQKEKPVYWLFAQGFAVILILSLPFFASTYVMHVSIQFLFVGFLCMAWNLIGGITGQFCFVHPLFFAAGVYIPWVFSTKFDLSPWLGIWFGVALAVIIGLFSGWLGFRYKLPILSFALMTLALSHIGLYVVMGLPQLGGTVGITIPLKGNSPFQFQFSSKAPYYFIVVFMVAGFLALSRYFLSSRIGVYFRAIRQNERAAASIGINVFGYKLLSLTISGGMTAIGGTFATQYFMYMDPHTAAGAHMWINIILVCVLGGLGTLWGPLVGSAFFVGFEEILRIVIGQESAVVNTAIFGIMIIVFVTLIPEGIVGRIENLRKRHRLSSNNLN